MIYPEQMCFESTYPVDSLFFKKKRFTTAMPHSLITISRGKEDITNFNLRAINKLFRPGEHVGLYEFLIRRETLIEEFIIDSTRYQLRTHLPEDSKKEFLEQIFTLNHVLLYGEVTMKDEVITRDDLCVDLGLNLLGESDPFTVRFGEGNPFINQFFLAEKGNDWVVQDRLAMGGGPATIFSVPRKSTKTVNVYLMKAIASWDEKAILNEDTWNHLVKMTNREKEMLSLFTSRLESSDLYFKRLIKDA